MRKDISYISIIVLMVIILLLRECGHQNALCPEQKAIIVKETEYVYDSVPKEIPVPKPYPIPGKDVLIPVPANVDTQAILQAYFTKKYYSQVISDDSLIATINDTVFNNQILSRAFTYKWLRPTTINHTEIKNFLPEQRMKLYGGFFLSGTKEKFSDIGPELLLTTRKGFSYKVNYGVASKQIGAGIHWQIKFKRTKND